MSVLIKNMEMPKGCIYANDNDQTEYCPLLNHDDVPFCQYIESEPEIAIGIGERPVYCPLSDVPEPCENTVSRQAAIDEVRNYYDPEDTDPTRIEDRIKRLPPTQSCEYWDAESGYCALHRPSAQPEDVARDIATIIENEKDMRVIERNAQQWIPCSERLSEKGKDVLVCYDFKGNRSVLIGALYSDEKFYGYDDEYLTPEGRKYRKAVAWMPLPEPYGGEE